ncbi:glycoside hydrolase family 3 N-terminal domain-containing protein [Bosea sp. BK604]|uniref:glycoside hydrolase family 3 N-terminal domain-containing protein n=1 Tax=Bosea sp. BK604 TaxID=2512180 RepID=UPI001A9D3440|nr:glycoside hydrolase family 3 N-terminal domain-containing protein [Bosea sp. BK604]
MVKAAMDHRGIEKLLSEMTLKEKVGQLTMLSGELVQTGPASAPVTSDAIKNGEVGSLLNLVGSERVRDAQRHAVEGSRLGIPLFFSLDVLYGLRTMFPIPLGESSAFDPALWEATARVAAEECAVEGIDLTFAPMIDIARDPRWGRTLEGPGEDALVGQRVARAKVRGYQTDDLAAPTAIAATAKHFAGYGAVLAGREYASVDMSERLLHEVYLPPFRAAVEAGVACLMPAFIDLNGTPMSIHVPLLRKLVRERWGFDGVIVSDWSSIAELLLHGVAARPEAAALALNAGVDIDMMGKGAYVDGLPEALDRGLVTMARIDEAVRRVLMLKLKLGLFDDPYRRCGSPEAIAASAAQPARRALAREAARKSIVLLTNTGATLPLKGSLKSIAIVGPFGEIAGGNSEPPPAERVAALVDQVKAAFPEAAVSVAAGSHVEQPREGGLAEALRNAEQSDVILLCLGERVDMAGEASSRAYPGLPQPQQDLARALLETGKPVVVLLFSGRPLIVPDWLAAFAKAILAVWHPGSEGEGAIADVLSGAYNPSGRLSMSWPADVGQIPIFFAERPTGRPRLENEHFSSKYLDIPNDPRFRFGHGLSYTSFLLSNPRATRWTIAAGETTEILVDVKNTGAMAGEHTVFLFIRDVASSITRPALELEDFTKVMVAPGEMKTVRFALSSDQLRFLGADLEPVLEPGAFEIFVGPSANPAQLQMLELQVRQVEARQAQPSPKSM